MSGASATFEKKGWLVMSKRDEALGTRMSITERVRKRKNRPGPGYADPDYELSLDTIAARQAVEDSQRRQTDPKSRCSCAVPTASLPLAPFKTCSISTY